MFDIVKRHRLLFGVLAFVFMGLPGAIDSIWSLVEKVGGASIDITWLMWVTMPIGFIFLVLIYRQGQDLRDVATSIITFDTILNQWLQEAP